MRNLLSELSKRVGIGAVAVAGLAIGGTAAAVVVGPTSSVEDVTPDTTEPAFAPTSSAPPTIKEPAPVTSEAVPTPEQPAQAPPPATVGRAPVPAAAAEQGDVVDPESIGTTGEDGYYTPAPPRQNPGEPPTLPEAPAPTAGNADPDMPTG